MLKASLVHGVGVGVAAAIIGSACSDAELTFGGPLSLDVTSNAPISVTDSLVLQYSVMGRTLLGMEVVWGDATVDSIPFSSAQSASGRVAHLYDSAGTFTLTATVDDALEGSVAEELSITINP